MKRAAFGAPASQRPAKQPRSGFAPAKGKGKGGGKSGGKAGGKDGGKGAAPQGGAPAKAGNPFQQALEAKVGTAVHKARSMRRSAAEPAAAPGNAKTFTKKAQSGRPVTERPLPEASLLPAKPAPAPVTSLPAAVTPLEPLTSLPLPDGDQRFVYLGPLSSTETEPLLRLFRPPASGAICVSMLHDWQTGRFLGIATVEFPSAQALREALEALLAPGSKELTLPNGERLRLGKSCSALRLMGTKICEESLTSGLKIAGHSLELMGACSQGVAERALEEFKSVAGATKTAKTLRRIARRWQHRAALARTPHTFLWRGEVTGLPLPEGPAQRMRAVLDALDWQAMGNNRNPTGKGKIQVENSFSLGYATNQLAETGPFTVPFAFRPGQGLWDGASVKKKHQEVWEAAMALLRSFDGAFHCTSIGFNKNFKGSPHRDDKDSGPQVATALGDYTGGRLRVYTQSGALDVDTKNRWCRFDGRYEHEVLPFKGTRYSVIFYQLEPEYAVDLSTTVEGVSGGREDGA